MKLSQHIAILHDGATIDIVVAGKGPVVLLPVNPHPVEGPMADEMRKWGNDPALGRSLIDGLSDTCKVIAFDYEGHVLQHPKPDTLTPDNIVHDFLSIADAVKAEQFAYYGYSWLALSGLQLALRTKRLSALIMGGYPPLDGPYDGMLKVTMATHELAIANQNAPKKETLKNENAEAFDWDNVDVTMSEQQTRQFVTLYKALQQFDDHAVQKDIMCPRLCFAGSADEIDYSEKWGGVHISLAKPLIEKKADLESFGWQVKVLEGMDHLQAMQAKNVLPIIHPWLTTQLLG